MRLECHEVANKSHSVISVYSIIYHSLYVRKLFYWDLDFSNNHYKDFIHLSLFYTVLWEHGMLNYAFHWRTNPF